MSDPDDQYRPATRTQKVVAVALLVLLLIGTPCISFEGPPPAP